MATRIRRARVEDAPAIAHVGARSWREGFRGIVPASIDPERAWSPRGVAERLQTAAERETTTLVAEVDEEIRGFLIYGPSRDREAGAETGEIWVLYVDPAYWRRGIGRDLVAAGLQGLREQGHEIATVWTLGESPRNLAFYESLGFRRDGASPRRQAFGRTLELRLRRRVPRLGADGSGLGGGRTRLRRFRNARRRLRWRSQR